VPARVGPDAYGASPSSRYDYERAYLFARRVAWRRGLSLLGAPLPEDRLLDVGANYGHFIEEAQAHGWQTHGVEHAERVRKQAVAGATSRLYGTMAEARRFAPYKAITLWDVLEHVAAPVPFLQELNELLAGDGRIVVRVPDARALAIAGSLYLTLCHPTNPEEHPHHYTPDSLRMTVGAADLRMVTTIAAGPEERVSAGRGVLDGALRGVLHRRFATLPYEFTAVLAR
jgi:2-polyprenyl-3-methyl-5-hydroxy-6-metoxy-1,4-benzoquinol methylase